MLTRKKCRLWLTGLLLCLLLLPGCGGPAPAKSTPASFTANLTAIAESGDEKALSAYKGNTCQLNAKVESVLPDGSITVRCTDRVRIRLSMPQEELQGLKMGDVLALEGTVTEVEIKQYGGMSNVTMTMDPAHVTGNVFAITGEVEKIYHDWDRNGQDYAAMMDNSVVQGRQVNVYLPEGHGLREGDSLSAKGNLTAPADYGGGLLAASEKGVPEVFVMYEPEEIQKELAEADVSEIIGVDFVLYVPGSLWEEMSAASGELDAFAYLGSQRANDLGARRVVHEVFY